MQRPVVQRLAGRGSARGAVVRPRCAAPCANAPLRCAPRAQPQPRQQQQPQRSRQQQQQHAQGAQQQHARRAPRARTVAAAAAVEAPAAEQLAALGQLQAWLSSAHAMPAPLLEPKRFKAPGGGAGERVGLIASRDVAAEAPLLVVPESAAITSIDAEQHPLIGEAAKSCSELVALALWLLAERATVAAGGSSAYGPLLAALPAATQSPILWDDRERAELLRGSPVLEEARSRQAALQQQWAQLSQATVAADPARFDPAHFNEAAFLRAFSVVLAHAAYLPSAECFALLPLAGQLGRTGNENGADLDYDAATGSVVLKSARPYREGQEVLINDGRPNGELLLCFGEVQDSNLADCLTFNASLIAADKYYQSKEQLLTAMGMSISERFPVYADRFPIQLLAYLRLTRIQDPGLFAKVSFDSDMVVSQMNEYEVLQLLMGECRERLAEYKGSLEEEIKTLQNPDLQGRGRLAARLRKSEKTILTQFMDAVRRKLAPVRGIPTKSGGMQDPNADFKEIFDTIEAIPTAPARLFDGIRRWARGDFDPEWKK
ncbi:histone-lysine N-methyltransferase [Raphidocelis subcapitata]|uniref:Histone-lysine N-methyltransferase n=1 Tax=Raphidocelis subcapitata TaxID=307507 RepID=A0A2V0NQS4_9CHLO|nr:histone-lysine N-methyltransferase [Raphidocelis subcapitata]|eukprot:GBF87903.1 histone-lysine N-methyltransferase [Raphidocelis subcapitata]